MNKKLGCSISDQEKKILDALTKKLKKSQGELIGELIRKYQNTSDLESVVSLETFDLSGEEQSEVENALMNSGSQLDVIARDGLLQRSRYLNSIAEKQARLESMSKEK